MSLESRSAGSVEQSARPWIVSDIHNHRTLKRGDIVFMVVSPDGSHFLLRFWDMTLHRVMDDSGKYVHLTRSDAPTEPD